MKLKEYFGLIAEITGMNPPRFKMPKAVLRVVASANEAIANVTKKEPVAAVEAYRHTLQDEYVSSEKAIRELGLRQEDIRTAIRKAVHWFLDNGSVDEERGRAVRGSMEEKAGRRKRASASRGVAGGM